MELFLTCITPSMCHKAAPWPRRLTDCCGIETRTLTTYMAGTSSGAFKGFSAAHWPQFRVHAGASHLPRHSWNKNVYLTDCFASPPLPSKFPPETNERSTQTSSFQKISPGASSGQPPTGVFQNTWLRPPSRYLLAIVRALKRPPLLTGPVEIPDCVFETAPRPRRTFYRTL